MPFPMSINGTVNLGRDAPTGGDPEATANRIEDMLREARATTITRHGNTVSFTAGMFRLVINWNVLVPFVTGTISVQPLEEGMKLNYKLSTIEMTIAVTAMMCIASILLLANDPTARSGIFVYLFLIFGWFWLVGGNYVSGMIRFRSWLWRGLWKDPAAFRIAEIMRDEERRRPIR